MLTDVCIIKLFFKIETWLKEKKKKNTDNGIMTSLQAVVDFFWVHCIIHCLREKY